MVQRVLLLPLFVTLQDGGNVVEHGSPAGGNDLVRSLRSLKHSGFGDGMRNRRPPKRPNRRSIFHTANSAGGIHH